jgi:hypothetical protein
MSKNVGQDSVSGIVPTGVHLEMYPQRVDCERTSRQPATQKVGLDLNS